MAQKAFIIGQDPPEIVNGNFRLQFPTVFCDSSTGNTYNDLLTCDVSATLLPSARSEVRNKVKSEGSSLHGFTLGNDDVYFMDWSRELL